MEVNFNSEVISEINQMQQFVQAALQNTRVNSKVKAVSKLRGNCNRKLMQWDMFALADG